VQIKTGFKVSRILTDGDKAIGIATDTDSYSSIQSYIQVLPNFFLHLWNYQSDYLRDLSRIDQTLSLTIWLGWKKKWRNLIMRSEVWSGRSLLGNAISNYDASIAPRGKQLVGFTFVIEDNKTLNVKRKSAGIDNEGGYQVSKEKLRWRITRWPSRKSRSDHQRIFCRNPLTGQGSLSCRDWYR